MELGKIKNIYVWINFIKEVGKFFFEIREKERINVGMDIIS